MTLVWANNFLDITPISHETKGKIENYITRHLQALAHRLGM
jgi:hypothetical protein